MKIFLIRHTKVDIEQGICYGQSDIVVAGSFEREKNEIKKVIRNIPFNKVFSSPLLRCRILAHALFINNQIRFDDRLKELDFGDWELKAWNEIYNSKQGRAWMDNYQTQPTLNGESYPEMVKRVSAFVKELEAEKIENVAIVAHAGVIRIIKSILEKIPIATLFDTFKPAYGSITEFEI